MLSALKFVQGAVAKKDYVPALTHFKIADGRILGHNGEMALSAPIALDLNCCPKADTFVKAIEACSETIQLHITEKKRLSVKSGAFKALVECLSDEYPTLVPEGTLVEVPSGILATLRELVPFISEDASRPWSKGILFREQSASVTNNIVFIEKFLGTDFPTFNVPEKAVTELLRINLEPKQIQISENSVTFHFEEGKWLRTQRLSTEWPDVSAIFEQEIVEPVILPEAFFTALKTVAPFANDLEQAFLAENTVATAWEDPQASVTVAGFSIERRCYNVHQLIAIQKLVEKIDLKASPAIFYGANLRGAIAGMSA